MKKSKTLTATMITVLTLSLMLTAIPIMQVNATAEDHLSALFFVSASEATWVADPTATGDYVVQLDTVGAATAAEYAVVRVYPVDTGITLETLLTAGNMPTFEYVVTTASADHNFLSLELYFSSGDGGHAEISLFPYTSHTELNNTEGDPSHPADWSVTADEFNGTTFAAAYGAYSNITAIAIDEPSYSLSTIIDDIIGNQTTAEDWELTRVGVQIGWVPVPDGQVALVDDITIAGVTYNLEPFVLDAEYYHVDSTVTVTNFNMSLNVDELRVDEHLLNMTATSAETGDSIGIDLVETCVDTGIFTGTFTIVDETPAVNELLVESADTITVSYFALEKTAKVDDVAPSVTELTPVEDAIISDNRTTISAHVTDPNFKLAWMTVDEIIRDSTATSPYTLTYTPPAVDPLAEGLHDIVVHAEDLAGNVNVTSWSFTVDTTEPTCVISMNVTSPINETAIEFLFEFNEDMSNETDVTIGGNATDHMTFDAKGWKGYPEDNRTFSANYTIKSADFNGTVLLTASDAEDLGGMTMIPANFTFYIDTIAPTAPENLTATALVDSIVLSWDASEDLGSGVELYEIIRNETTMVGSVDHPTLTFTDTSIVESGIYFYQVKAYDFAGNPSILSEAANATLTLGPVTSYNITLSEGWNLISLPLIPDNSSIEAVLADIADVDKVWSYDAVTSEWFMYSPAAPEISDLTKMEDGKGYWISMTATATLTVHGVEFLPPPATPPAYHVVPGWNLIGFKEVESMNASVYLEGVEYVRLWSFVNDRWILVGPDDEMIPGFGYWIAVTEEGWIYP